MWLSLAADKRPRHHAARLSLSEVKRHISSPSVVVPPLQDFSGPEELLHLHETCVASCRQASMYDLLSLAGGGMPCSCGIPICFSARSLITEGFDAGAVQVQCSAVRSDSIDRGCLFPLRCPTCSMRFATAGYSTCASARQKGQLGVLSSNPFSLLLVPTSLPDVVRLLCVQKYVLYIRTKYVQFVRVSTASRRSG